jgi:hypothetical protein
VRCANVGVTCAVGRQLDKLLVAGGQRPSAIFLAICFLSLLVLYGMAPTKRPVFGQSDEHMRKKLRSAMSRMLRSRIPAVPASWGPVDTPTFKEEPDDVLKVAYLKRACGSDSEPPDTSRGLPEDLLSAMSWADGKSAEEIMAARDTTMKVVYLLLVLECAPNLFAFCSGYRRMRRAVHQRGTLAGMVADLASNACSCVCLCLVSAGSEAWPTYTWPRSRRVCMGLCCRRSRSGRTIMTWIASSYFEQARPS